MPLTSKTSELPKAEAAELYTLLSTLKNLFFGKAPALIIQELLLSGLEKAEQSACIPNTYFINRCILGCLELDSSDIEKKTVYLH